MQNIKFIFLTIISVILFGMNVYAVDTEKMELLKEETLEYYNFQLSDSMAESILNYWQNHPDNYMYSGKTGSTWFSFVFSTSDTRYDSTDQTVQFRNGDRAYEINTDGSSYGFINNNANFYAPNGHEYGLYENYGNNIDFDTVYYSANIPVPNIKVTYSTINDTSVANVPLYVEFSDRGNLSGLYIDYRVQFLPVNYISVNVQRGNVTYSRIDPDTNYVTYDVISNSDLQMIDDLYYQSSSDNYMTRYKTVMSEKWGEFLNDYSPEANLSFTFPTNLNAGLQEMYKTKYRNVRTTQTMFGNYMRIWVRYFIIDEENHYKVGAWRVWECYDSSASEWGVTMPEYYIYGDNAVGTTNVYSDENADTNQDIPMNSGTPTGENNPNIQVTVNQNVPNYPDYPTAVSYNHDNVLMQFIQTANYIPQMFSGFTSFLTAAFAFIPSGIWTIIGMGFLSSIVIMIIKVL